MNQQRPGGLDCNQFRHATDFVTSGPSPQISVGGPNIPNIRTGNPPPLPPRNRPAQNYPPSYGGSYGPSGTYGSGYGYGSYRGYGSYGSYGSYGGYPGTSAYNSYGQFNGPSGDVENRFMRMAEESTRPAFQSIEAMVHTFSSVTMMLESTFFAMTSSFRAILSVAENVGRLRSMFGQFLSTFALIRFVKWLYRKTMYTMGLRPDDPNSEDLWQRTVLEVMNGERRGPSGWPILIFLSILFAIPYLIHKLVMNAKEVKLNVNDPKEWVTHNEPIYTATALYDFNATSMEELSLRTGQKVWLAPQSLQPKGTLGWLKATDSTNVGLIPSNYVTLVGQLKKKSESDEPQTTRLNASDASIQNIATYGNQNMDHQNECDSKNLEGSCNVQTASSHNIDIEQKF